MERLSVWVSAGLLSAGVSAAVLAGAGLATADDSTPGPKSDSKSESSTSTGGAQTDSSAEEGSAPDTKPDPEADPETAPEPSAEADADADAAEKPGDDTVTDNPKKKKRSLTARTDAVTALEPDSSPVTASAPEPEVSVAAPADPVVQTPAVTDIAAGGAAAIAKTRAQPSVSLALVAPEASPPVQAAAAAPPNLFRWIEGVANSVVTWIGSLAFNSLQALESLVTGPPVLPPNSTVTVRNSTILLSTGQRVNANWYYPEGDEVPEKLIVLQHGFFALGPMYSFTAANLAASTGAIVVTPTISSNPFAGDDNWINGDGLASAIADLFVGDRKALTDSALAAGFATRYGLDPADARLPEKFGLAGHSAGAGLVTSVAGYLVDKGAADDLVGVITLDGVPLGSAATVALGKLQAYEDETGHYIPIREIGAPSNAFNSRSELKADLNAARPGRFNGVVLSGGVHMDSMQGGNPLIQFGAFLIAGFPQPQNPPAVAQLSTQWFNDWFAGDTDNGDELPVGTVLPISTANGTAQGTVIKTVAVPASSFVTVAV